MRSNILIFLFLAVTASGCTAEHLDQIQALNRAGCDNAQTSDCANGSDDANRTYRAGQQRLNNQLNRQIN